MPTVRKCFESSAPRRSTNCSSTFPRRARLGDKIGRLPDHLSEMAVERELAALSRRNLVAGDVPFFLGCGAYKHHIPASVDHLIQRGEFLTSYTPYQPEIAQGTLQALFEFQTQVARLYGCDVANASMYDGSTACWEAIGMARRITRRGKAIVSSGLHPHYVSVAKTMARFTGDVLEAGFPELGPEPDTARLLDAIDGETSCVVVQYPDILGRIGDLSELAERCHAAGALLVAVVTEPVALGAIRSPARWAPTSSSAKASRSASASISAGPMSACSRPATNMSGRCPEGWRARPWTRKGSAASSSPSRPESSISGAKRRLRTSAPIRASARSPSRST
jgi:glycine cleavage system pyridoxal-binding protein P